MACARGCCNTQREHYRSLTTAVGLNTGVQNQAMSRLDRYEDATRQGVQPRSTNDNDITSAMRISEATGTAFRGDQL